MKQEATAGSVNSGVNALTGQGLAKVSTITEHEAAQVERANAYRELPSRNTKQATAGEQLFSGAV